jgi:MFS family permease
MPIGVFILTLGVAGCTAATEIWHLYLLFGVVAAIGSCLTGFVPNMAVVANWFIRRRGMAIGLFNAGWGASFIFVPISHYLISALGWRNAYLAIGATVFAFLVPLILIFHRHRPQDIGLLPDGDTQPAEFTADTSTPEYSDDSLAVNRDWAARDWSLGKAIRTMRFWALFLANLLFWGMGINLLVAHQVAFAVDVGFTVPVAATAVSLYGIMVLCGNLFGFLSDRWGREIAFTLGAIVVLLAVADLFLINNWPLTWMLFSYATLLGFGAGLIGPALTSSVADLFQGRSFGLINGVVVMGFGLAGALSPWLGGLVFDITGSYIPAFYMILGVVLLSCVSIWIAGPRKVRLVPGKMAPHNRRVR